MCRLDSGVSTASEVDDFFPHALAVTTLLLEFKCYRTDSKAPSLTLTPLTTLSGCSAAYFKLIKYSVEHCRGMGVGGRFSFPLIISI